MIGVLCNVSARRLSMPNIAVIGFIDVSRSDPSKIAIGQPSSTDVVKRLHIRKKYLIRIFKIAERLTTDGKIKSSKFKTRVSRDLRTLGIRRAANALKRNSEIGI